MNFSRGAQNFFYLGGGFAPVRGQKILEIIDFPDPGGGWSPIPPLEYTSKENWFKK